MRMSLSAITALVVMFAMSADAAKTSSYRQFSTSSMTSYSSSSSTQGGKSTFKQSGSSTLRNSDGLNQQESYSVESVPNSDDQLAVTITKNDNGKKTTDSEILSRADLQLP